MALAASAGFLGALLEAMIVGEDGADAFIRLFVISAASALIGFPQWGALVVFRRLVNVERFSAIWAASTSRRAENRTPVLRLHALGVSIMSGLLILTAVTTWITMRLRTLDEGPLAALLTTVFVLAATVLAASLVVGGSLWLPRLLGPLDRRVRLPFPPGVGAYLVFVGLPVATLTAYALYTFASDLGTLALVFLIPPFFALEGLIYRLPAQRRAPRWFSRAGIAVWFAAVFGAFFIFGDVQSSGESAKRGVALPASVALLQNLTDLDRDGFSSLLDGGDCAPIDAGRSPSARDTPGNGIDENCDGQDTALESESAHKRRVLHGAIDDSAVRKYNVIWIVIDAMRADSVGFTRFEGKKKRKGPSTTPYLDQLAKESWVFDNAYSQSSMTMISMPSMFAGRWPGHMTWRKHTNRPNAVDKETLIAEQLVLEGYRTGTVANGYLIKRLPGQFQGQDETLDFWLDGRRKPWFRMSARLSVGLALDFIHQDPSFPKIERPFFLTLYTDGPHAPYIKHPDSGYRTGNSERSKYFGEIADTDQHVKFFLEYLRYQDGGRLWDNTIIIVTADHGEEFKEHGNSMHARTCYEESVHVPLLVRIPGMEPAHIETRVALIDVVPTLLDFLGLAPAHDDLDGQSLAIPVLDPESVDPARPIFCTTTSLKPSFGKFLLRSVRREDSVLIADLRNNKKLLFNTQADRQEAHDLSKEPDRQTEIESLEQELAETLTGNIAGLFFF